MFYDRYPLVAASSLLVLLVYAPDFCFEIEIFVLDFLAGRIGVIVMRPVFRLDLFKCAVEESRIGRR